jgi:hypothetical protein
MYCALTLGGGLQRVRSLLRCCLTLSCSTSVECDDWVVALNAVTLQAVAVTVRVMLRVRVRVTHWRKDGQRFRRRRCDSSGARSHKEQARRWHEETDAFSI